MFFAISILLLWGGYSFWHASQDVSQTKQVTIIYDQEFTYVVETEREFVGEVLRDQHIDVYPEDLIKPYVTEKITDNQVIFIDKATSVTITNFVGETHSFRTRAQTVATLMQEIGYVKQDSDRIKPDLNTRITDGLSVLMLKFDTEEYTEEEQIAYNTEYRTDASLEMPNEIIEQTGENGLRVKMFKLEFENDELVNTILLSEVVEKEPVTEIITVGTKMPPSGTEIETGVASFYGDGFNGRLTASGVVFDNTVLMAAHRTLPFGTIVKVTNVNNGQSIIVEITDRGPYVDGRVIDLSASAFESIAPLSRGVVHVTLEVAE